MKFTQLAKSLKESVAPAYLIEGEEAYFRDAAVKAVSQAVGITQPLLNNVRYEGETLKGDKLLSFRDELYTLPFFDEKRIVRAYGFFPTERDWENVVAPYLEKPCLSTVLLIVNEGKKANTAELKKKKGLVYVDCGREDEETLSRCGRLRADGALLRPRREPYESGDGKALRALRRGGARFAGTRRGVRRKGCGI